MISRRALALALSAFTASPVWAQAVLGGSDPSPHAPGPTVGTESDWYLDFASGRVYGPKAYGQWPPAPATTLGPGRTIAVGSYTLYVGNNAGTASDGNDCLTFATACATITGAKNKAYQTFDSQGYNVTINIWGGTGGGDGTGRYDEAISISQPLPGDGQIILSGTSNPKLYSTAGVSLSTLYGARVKAQNLTLQSASGGSVQCSNTQFGGVLVVTGVTINGCGGPTFDAQNGGSIIFQGNAVTFASGITVGSVFHANALGQMNMDSATITCAGALTLTNYFVGVGSGYVEAIGTTFSGCSSVSGIKYSINRNGIIRTNTNNINFFPGDTNGTNISGGTFDMFQALSTITRTISSGVSDTASPGDNVINWAAADLASKTQVLPICSLTNGPMIITVKDAVGNAGTYPIAINSPLSTIDNSFNYIIGSDYGSVDLTCDAGSNWIVSATASRRQLGATTTFYTGNAAGTASDLNDCRSSAKACATIQHTINVAQTDYDAAGNNVYIHVYGGSGGGSGTGTYAENLTISGPLVGGGLLTIDGESQPVIHPASGTVVSALYGARAALRGVTLSTTGAGAECVNSQFNASTVSILTGVIISGCGDSMFNAQNTGSIAVSADFTISAGATAASIFQVSNNGTISADSRTITCGGALTLTTAASATAGYIEAIGDTFSGCGSATGSRFTISSGGIIRTSTNNLSYFPGSTAGLISAGGTYDTFTNQNSIVRSISSGTTDTASLGDKIVTWNSATASPKSQTIPACSVANGPAEITIKDGANTAGTNNITITPASGTIEGAATLVISTNHGSAQLACDLANTNWIKLN